MNSSDIYQQRASAAQADPVSRAQFIKNTYLHLAGAILAFGIIEGLLLRIPGIHGMALSFMSSGMSWLIVLAAFMFVSHIANKWAHSDTSAEMQYAGLGLYIVAEAIIFLPLVIMAQFVSVQKGMEPNAILYKAAAVTVMLFASLTFIALTSKRDFSFLGGFLKIAFFTAMGLIVASMIFGFQLGILFSAIMVLVAGAMVLFQTSKIVHEYGTSQHVAASLGLFASFALMLWYVIQIFMSRD